MKLFLLSCIALLVVESANSQNYPQCTDLIVENITVDGNGHLLVEISNSCADCHSGISGCLYAEMRVYDRDDPSSIIAEFGCWCLMTPDNNSVYIYQVPMTDPNLFLLSLLDLRVWFNCGSSGFCEDIPFSENLLAVTDNNMQPFVNVYPNLQEEMIKIISTNNINLTAKIFDVTGKTLLSQRVDSDGQINISILPQGIYLIHITDHTENYVITKKFIKT